MYKRQYLFGDNESVVKSGTIPHSQLHKRHHGLAYHFTREAVASEAVSFHYLPGPLNPADTLSKHWGYQQVWPLIQPILFWRGNTGKLLSIESSSNSKKGSDKYSVQVENDSGKAGETEQPSEPVEKDS